MVEEGARERKLGIDLGSMPAHRLLRTGHFLPQASKAYFAMSPGKN